MPVTWRVKNVSYYIAPVGDRTHDLPHTVASNMIKVSQSHALYHSATAAECADDAALIDENKVSTIVACHLQGGPLMTLQW